MIRTLIVEDQKFAKEAIKYILQQDAEIEIVGFANNGQEAIELAEILNPDIILMDLEMPNLDGLTATKTISQKNAKINIIILSFSADENLLTRVLDAGAKGYLFKGIVDNQEILRTIHLIYEQNSLEKLESNQHKQLYIDNSNAYKHQDAILKVADSNRGFANVRIEKTNEQKFEFSNLILILKRRYIPALMGFSGVLLGAVLYLIFAERTYQAWASIRLENRQESISELGKDLSSIPGSNEYSPLASQARLIDSVPVINSALENIAQTQEGYSSEQLSFGDVRDNLEIKVIPNTNILQLSYVNSDPELSALILNEIIDTVVAKNTDNIRLGASSVREFLEKKVTQQRQQLSQLETSENRYRAENGIVDLDNQTANLVNGLNNLETQEQDLLAQIKEQETKVNNFQQLAKVEDAESAYNKSQIGQDPQLENLRTRLTEVDAELAAARSNFTDNNPAVITLKEKRAEILNLYQQQVAEILGEGATASPSELTENRFSQDKDGISQEVFSQLVIIQNQLDANRSKLQAIQTEKAKLSDRINSLPASVQSLTELVRQREQANENLQFLQRKLEEARIAEAQLVSNIQVIELANIPSSPSSPKVPLVLAVASTIGIILAAGIILLLEKIDSTLYDGKETEWQLNIPFLSVLPNLSNTGIGLREIKSFLNDRDLYEPYRSLLKNLESRLENRLKVIVVTSAIPQEGKSVVASHLGAVSAMLSKRTLIIDAHLSQPEQNRLFDVKLSPGLREIVTEGLDLDRAVQSTRIKNLSILTSGVSAKKSLAIVESPKMKNILQQAAFQYDLVIIDTPPVNSSCDAYALSKYSDGLVMVTQPLYTDKKLLKQAVEELKRNKASILGFVINHANNKKPMLKSDRDGIKKLPLLTSSPAQTNNSHRNSEEVKRS